MIIGEGVRLWNDAVATAPGSTLCDQRIQMFHSRALKTLCAKPRWRSF